MRSPTSRYQRRLAAEQRAAEVYRALASGRTGDERESLLALARAEERHAEHWRALLRTTAATDPPAAGLRIRALGWLVRRISSLLVLAVIQRAELDGTYDEDLEAGERMAADERLHARIVEGLARRRRARASGMFRAAMFGINDGLVSNVSLVLGMAGGGAGRSVILLAGLAGLLAGALSMAAGEYVSVRSQRELLAERASKVDPQVLEAAASGDRDRLVSVLRAAGMPDGEAEPFADALLREPDAASDDREVIGSAAGAALSSFAAFAAGAVVPVVPYLLTGGPAALAWALALTGVGLFTAGMTAGVLTGGPLFGRGLRQLAIGAAAAGATYGLGALLNVQVS